MRKDHSSILYNNINGFHQLSSPSDTLLTSVSVSFCKMLGYTEKELVGSDFADLVHPDDRETFKGLMQSLSPAGNSVHTARFRVRHKSGRTMTVSESVSVNISKSGVISVCGVMTDISQTVSENTELDYLRSTVPCGFLTLTCDEHPKIIYMNERMSQILRVPESAEGVPYPMRLLGNDVYLMIPVEERMEFAQIISSAQSAGGKAVYGELSAIRFDSVRIRLSGWMSKYTDESGNEMLRAVCTDITDRYNMQKERAAKRYLSVLGEVYEKIFLCDLSGKTITLLESGGSEAFNNIRGIPMHLDQAISHWIDTIVSEESRQTLRGLAADIFDSKTAGKNGGIPKTQFSAVSSSGEEKRYIAAYIPVDEAQGLFCCKRAEENGSRRGGEVTAGVQELVMQMTDGIVAFEIEDARIRPLYASDNVRTFFGYSKEEWSYLARKSRTLKDFVSRSGIPYSDFVKIFDSGEAEFEYTDTKSGTRRRIRAVSSHSAEDGAPQYVMLYNTTESVSSDPAGSITVRPRVYIRTFGYFDVFIGDKPIAFRNEKSKELFALLVDRKGGYISAAEGIGFLWEDEPVNTVTQARYRKVVYNLKNILAEHGIADIVASANGKHRLVTENVRCDLYDYLSHREKFAHLFKGSYLTNYSWGETTLAELVN